jgi:adenylate cyclase
MAGIAYYFIREFEEAKNWLSEAIGRAPNHQYGHAFLAATYAQLGRSEDAQAESAKVMRLNPTYSIGGTQKQVSCLKRAEDMEHLVDGLRKAGLPE